MENLRISIANILARYFSISGVVKKPNDNFKKDLANLKSEVQGLTFYEPAATSQLGTPIIDVVKILSGTIPATNEAYNEFVLKYCQVSLQKSKDIVETKVQGAKGTVKEYISEGDWNITIQGFLLTDINVVDFPETETRELSQLLALPATLEVESRVLNTHEIHNLVIYDYNFPTFGERLGIQPYEIRAKSDEVVELESWEDAKLRVQQKITS